MTSQQAFLLIKIKEGTLDTVVQEMSKAKEVEQLYHATGAFDIIAIISAETVTQLINYTSALREKDYIGRIGTVFAYPVKKPN